MMRRRTILSAVVVSIVLLMILSVLPSTVGESEDRSTSRTQVIEIGRDRQELPPNLSGLFLPFMKHEYGYGPGCRGLFLYQNSLLQSYGIESEGKLLRISFLNMWGGQTYNHGTAGPGYSPGIGTYLNFRLKMGLTTRPSCTSTFSSHYDVAGPVTVYYKPGWYTIWGSHMNWMDFQLDTPFDYDGTSNLVIEFEWDAISGANMGSLNGGPWSHTSYYRLRGNIFTGQFKGNNYATMSWCPYAQYTYGTIYGPPNDSLPVLQIEGEFGIPAEMRMEPQSLNLESNGNYMNVKVENFPENPEYTPLDVEQGTVRVEEIGCELKYGTWNENRYITKVDRLLVEDAIGAPGDDIELKVTGYLVDGTYFKGVALIDTHANIP
jgi:hypothetical protein